MPEIIRRDECSSILRVFNDERVISIYSIKQIIGHIQAGNTRLAEAELRCATAMRIANDRQA